MNPQNDYQFVKVPIYLFYRLDCNTSRVLITMIQMSDYYAKENGWFYRTMNNLEDAIGLSENVIRAAMDALYREGLIEVSTVGASRGKKPNGYRVCFERFKDYENVSLDETISSEEGKIETTKYKGSRFTPSYLKEDNAQQNVQMNAQEIVQYNAQENAQKVSTNIDNIANIENIKNIEFIENIDNENNIEIIDNEENIDNVEDIEYFEEDIQENYVEEIDNKYFEKDTDYQDFQKEDTIYVDETADVYLKGFLEDPTQDYSKMITDITYFVQRNNSRLQELQERLRERCKCDMTIQELIDILSFMYKEKISYKVTY